jgi:ketosteroid isomerase-like protein
MNQTVVNQFIDSLPAAFEAGDTGAAAKVQEAQNVRRLQELYRAIARGDFPAAIAAMTDDIELQIFGTAEFDFIRQATGPTALLAAMQANYAKMEDQRPEIISLIAQGNTVAVLMREQGRYRPTGKPYDLRGVQLFEFRDGQVARLQEFGASESPAETG